jgi:lipopolysaccharide export system protein LptA
VVSSDLSVQNGGTNSGAVPARISSDTLTANTLTGEATYSGQARLWQGDSLIQADTITLDRNTRVLTATNHVKAVFPQAAWAPASGMPGGQTGILQKNAARPASADGKPEFWRAEANRMTYDSNQGRGRLEQNVYTHSSEGAIRADTVELFFAPSGGSSNGTQSAGGPASQTGLGGQQLVRATAVGKVVVEEEDRHGTSTRADYTASEGKFVLSGGPPIVYDTSGNSTTGRQLTLFFADDRILIDSAEGLRTLTLHRVEK